MADRIARECELAMRNAQDYKTWREAAAELDHREGLDEWKADDSSDDYDWRLIRARLRQLRKHRADGDVVALVHSLRQGLHWNIGNLGNPHLYAGCRVGTKDLVNDYVNEVVAVLEYLCENDFPDLPHAEKVRFFNEVALSFGRSALLLSGGATLGLFHVGVVKALVLEDLMPTVISGSSAGSVVAGAVGSRTPEELEELLDPENAYYHFWRPLKLTQMISRGSIMDPVQVRKAISKNIRDMTFEEAYRVSGKAINITVSPAGTNQSPRLVNYLTFPYLYVREAVMASCAVPFLFPPVMLMTKDEQGQRVPFMPLLKWNDGSLKSDLPVLRLRRLHNVNHFIVSQTNPHVIPFMARSAPGGGGLLASSREFVVSTALNQSKSIINLLRANLPVVRLQRPLEAMAAILDQEYRGNVNILPRNSLWRFMRVTANPKLEDVKRFILEGERATWAHMSQVRNQIAISQTLDRCVERLDNRHGTPMPRDLAPHARLRVVRSQ
jgi:TAG lipase / steryl ester hydrolase / phospholipase A2 / LPA acyltransferase